MTRTEDVGQAERRTASGRGLAQPLNLIHRNNSPKPVSMRVPGRLPRLILNPVRTALYLPVRLAPHLPGGPLRWVWIVRLVVTLDTPLRRYLLGGVNART